MCTNSTNIQGQSNDEIGISCQNINYVINKKVYTQDYGYFNCNIEYPEINGINPKFQSQWDETIKYDIMESAKSFEEYVIQMRKNMPEENIMGSLSIIFEVTTQDSDKISIIVKSLGCLSDTRRGVNIRSYNIDLKTGKSIKLSEVIDTQEYAAKIVVDKNYKIITDDEFNEQQDEQLISEYKNLISDCYSDNIKYIKEYLDDPQTDFYYKNNKLVICIYTGYTIGHYFRIIVG